MMGDIIVGKCSRCGGIVSTPGIWMGVQRPPQKCESCGGHADMTRNLPVIPVNRPNIRRSEKPFYSLEDEIFGKNPMLMLS